MKKFFKFLLIFFLTVVILCGGTVGVFAILIIDNTDLTNQKYEDKELDYLLPLSNLMVKSLNDTPKNEKISFTLYPEDVEYVIYAVIDEIKDKIPQEISINGTKLTCEQGKYILKVSASYLGISSVATISLEFKEVNDTFYIKVKDINLGQLPLNNQLVHYFIDELDISVIEDNLEKINIYCSIDIKNLQLSISKNDIQLITHKLIVEKNPEYKIFDLLLKYYQDNKELYQIDTRNELSLLLNLNKFKYNTNYGELVDLNLEDIDNKVEALLENKVISYSDVNLVTNYLISGYNYLNEDGKNTISSFDLSSIGITNNSSYEGTYLRSSTSMIDHVNELEIDYTLGSNSASFLINQDTINDVVQSNEIFAKTIAFAHSDDTTNVEYKNQVSYITIEPLVIDLKDNKIEVNLPININGYIIGIHGDFIAENQDGLTLIGHLSSLKIGELELEYSFITETLSYLDSLINEDWITINSSSHDISLDFSNLLVSNNSLLMFLQLLPTATSSIGVENNNIKITYSI